MYNLMHCAQWPGQQNIFTYSQHARAHTHTPVLELAVKHLETPLIVIGGL